MWVVVFLLVVTGCGKKGKDVGGQKDVEVGVVDEAERDVSLVELGFATRVPADSDLFFSALYDGKEVTDDVVLWGQRAGMLEEGSVQSDKDGQQLATKMEEVAGYLGSEFFVFSGSGVGEKLKMVGSTYRELSAAWGGFVVGGVLDAFAKDGKDLDFEDLGNGLGSDLLDRWLSVLEKESRVLVPSVVVGWHPYELKRDLSRDAVVEIIDDIFEEAEGAVKISFEDYGAEMVGYEIEGTEVFGSIIKEMRDGLAEKSERLTYGKGLSAERLEQFLEALEDVKFTVASGVVDGRVLVYFGDGAEGFKLAEKPEDSLAAKDDLSWMLSPHGERLVAVGYLSEKMVGSALPWLDSSNYWEAVAGAVRSPIQDQRLMRQLLTGLGDTSRSLGKRDVSAWSGAVFSGGGWKLLTRGGILDPSLDFQTPLRMTSAVGAANPAFRGHWIQKRGWNDLSWKKSEYMGLVLEALWMEIEGDLEEETEILPGGTLSLQKIFEAVRSLNGAYRDEFRDGIGDEVAFFGDFLGDMPTVPGLSQETVRDFKVPRFVYARPVTDRAMLSKSGESFVETWKDMIVYANGLGDGNLGIPLILPQSIDSNEQVTWYAPLPFIGGDFVPGITLDDNIWMVGTSRSLTGGLASALETENGSQETGVLIEVNFDSLEVWLRSVYELGKDDAEAAAGADMNEREIVRINKSADGILDSLTKLRSLKYRHWLESGEPRTSLVVEFDEK